MVARLLKVEQADEPTEIVIHVNMLKEGWDVTNLYTIIPLRAANARVLIEQSIGRGLRLPYGKRTGVVAVDRLNIIAHDRFQEIVNEANRPDSTIRMQAVVMDPDALGQKTKTVISQPILEISLGVQPTNTTTATEVAGSDRRPAFDTLAEQEVARVTYQAIRKMQSLPAKVPSVWHLGTSEVQQELIREVAEQYRPLQMELSGVTTPPDIAAVVAKTSDLVIRQTIAIPRILVQPKGEVRSGFEPFELALGSLSYQAPSEELWIQHLRTGQTEVVGLGQGGIKEARSENYIVRALMDFDDVAYDGHSDLLYDLAAQVVTHLRASLSEEDTDKVLQLHQREIARFIHAQMQEHRWEATVELEVVVKQGFTDLKESAYTASANDPPLDFRHSPSDKSNMAKYLFGGFERCLHPVQKFHSEAERVLASILERESEKWFKPAKGQFQIWYRSGSDHLEYQPDFVAETATTICMLEVKARNQMQDADVLAKQRAAVEWCGHASAHAASCGGKPWVYLLIPHDTIAENMTITGLTTMAPAPA